MLLLEHVERHLECVAAQRHAAAAALERVHARAPAADFPGSDRGLEDLRHGRRDGVRGRRVQLVEREPLAAERGAARIQRRAARRDGPVVRVSVPRARVAVLRRHGDAARRQADDELRVAVRIRCVDERDARAASGLENAGALSVPQRGPTQRDGRHRVARATQKAACAGEPPGRWCLCHHEAAPRSSPNAVDVETRELRRPGPRTRNRASGL